MARPSWSSARRAGAETLIIMVGVFLGLAADEWRQSMDRAQRERVLLEELRADLVANTAELETTRLGHERVFEGAASLIHLIESDSTPEVAVPELIGRVLLANYRFDGKSGSLDAYLNGGDLGIVSSPMLRAALAEWSTRRDELWLQESRGLAFVDESARPLLVGHADALSLMGWNSAAPGRVLAELRSRYRVEPRGIEELLADPQLANLASVRLNLAALALQRLSALVTANEQVLALLESELGKAAGGSA